jgi:hypothetical protein
VPAPTADALRAGLERLESELAAAVRLADAGLGPAADLPAVFARHAAALAPDVLEQAREVAGSAELRPLAAWAVALHGRRAGAEHEALARRWRATAVARGPGGGAEVPYAEVDAALAATADRGARLAVDAARAAAAATGYARLARERFARERGAVEALGIADGYLATWEALTGVDARALADAAAAFTRDTGGAWDDVLAESRAGGSGGAATCRRLLRATSRRSSPTRRSTRCCRRGGARGRAHAVAAMGLDPGRRAPAARGRRRAPRAAAPARGGGRPGARRGVRDVAAAAGGASWRACSTADGGALHAANASLPSARELRPRRDRPAGARVRWAALRGPRGGRRLAAPLRGPRPGARGRGPTACRLRRPPAPPARRGGAPPGARGGRRRGPPPARPRTPGPRSSPRRPAPARPRPTSRGTHGPGSARRRGCEVASWPCASPEQLRERFDEDWWRNPRAGPWLASTVCAPGNAAPPFAGDGADEATEAAALAGRAARAAESALR